MKIHRVILFFAFMSVLLAACTSPATPTALPTQTLPPHDDGGLVFHWRRSGGSAGVCDAINIFGKGAYVAYNCNGTETTGYNGKLDDAQLKQLTGWVSTIKSFDSGDKNSTPTITFVGSGSASPSPEQIQAMGDLATALAAKPVPAVTDGTTASFKAREFLAVQLGISEGLINITKVEAVEWSDACLGIVRMGVLCAQAITPGFRVILDAQGTSYELHTDGMGDQVQLVTDPSQVKP